MFSFVLFYFYPTNVRIVTDAWFTMIFVYPGTFIQSIYNKAIYTLEEGCSLYTSQYFICFPRHSDVSHIT